MPLKGVDQLQKLCPEKSLLVDKPFKKDAKKCEIKIHIKQFHKKACLFWLHPMSSHGTLDLASLEIVIPGQC